MSSAEPSENNVADSGDEQELLKQLEPKPKSSFQIIKFINVGEWIWILLGAIFAAGFGALPVIFYLILGDSFNNIASASAEEIARVSAQNGLSYKKRRNK